VDVPAPFELRVQSYLPSDHNGVHRVLFGQIISHRHLYNGRWALLSLRTVEKPVFYNVLLFERKPSVSTASLKLSDDAEVAVTGFVLLDGAATDTAP